MRNTAHVIGGKPIDVFLQSISGVSAINPLVAFYDIHGGKREVLFFNLSRTPYETTTILPSTLTSSTLITRANVGTEKYWFGFHKGIPGWP
jgi:hypothetical protein